MFEQRLNIHDILEDSPSLSGVLEDRLDSSYRLAVSQAASETGISWHVFPKTCPYTLAKALENGWLPDDLV